MKKLLVTAIGAAAAFGAVAGTISTQRFESVTGELPFARTTSELNALAGTTDQTPYWVGDDLTNTYKVVEVSPSPDYYPFVSAPTKGLEVKTVFGNPLTLNAVAGGTATTIPATGLYFDSEVKFTVCEDEPDQTYDNAKIVMWLQEKLDGETVTGTNLIVRAGYLSKPDTTIISTATNYVCALPTDFDIDAWHRVTIKAMANITTGSQPVPGFAIYIDKATGGAREVGVNCMDAKWADGTFAELTEAADWLNDDGALFPTMDLTSGTVTSLASAGFDGTGSITDLHFTDVAPTFAEDYVAPKAAITINNVPYGPEDGYTDLAAAITALNGITVTGTDVPVKFSLINDVAYDGDLTIENSDVNAIVIIDLAGKVLTVDNFIFKSPVTITDSSVGGKILGDIYVDLNEAAGAMTLLAGTIDGYIDGTIETIEEEDVAVYKERVFLMGGTVMQNDIDPVDGYVLEQVGETDFYNVVVIPTYTVKFISGEGTLTTQEVTKVSGGEISAGEVDAVVEVTGKSFSAWNPAVAFPLTVTGNAEYTAQYTNNFYTITFVIGENSTSEQLEYNSTITSVPNIPVRSGYTGSWDDDPAGDTVTGDKTYTYTYTGKSYTVNTYTNNALYATYSSTYAGSDPVLAAPIVGEGQSWDSKWYTENGGETEFSFNPDAEGVQNAYATITSSGPVVPDIPAGGETDCGSTEAATDAAAAINADAASKAAHIAVPAGVSDASTYLSYVEAKAVGTKVTVDFSDAGTTVAQASANTDVVALPVAAAAAGNTTADVSSVAGFYYSIVSGATPSTVTTEGTRVLGTGGTITLALPKVGTAGFYKVKVSATAK